MKWKPIKSAKKSEQVVDIWSPSYGRLTNYRRVRLSDSNVFYEPVISGVCCVRDATHWMPLPEPPK